MLSYKDTNNCFIWQTKDQIKYLNVVQILTFIIFYEKKKFTLKEVLKILDYFRDQSVGQNILLFFYCYVIFKKIIGKVDKYSKAYAWSYIRYSLFFFFLILIDSKTCDVSYS